MRIKPLSPRGVKRFTNLDFYGYLLITIGRTERTDVELAHVVSSQPSSYQEYGFTLLSHRRFKGNYTLTSVLQECLAFDLIKEHGGRFTLTEEGFDLLELFINRKQDPYAIRLAQKMEASFGGLSLLISELFRINPSTGLLVMPKPTAFELGLSNSSLLENSKYVKDYSTRFSERAMEDFQKYMPASALRPLNQRKVEQHLQERLSEELERFKRLGHHHINIQRTVRNIMTSYYVQTFFAKKIDRVSFEVWSARAHQLGLINTSEFFPDSFCKIVYPTSVIRKQAPASFRKVAPCRDSALAIFSFNPTFDSMKEQFVETLWTTYSQLSQTQSSLYVSVLDIRDIVCYKLQLNELIFRQFLERSYRMSINKNMRWDISLEVDRLPEERVFVKSRRFPILINGLPKNIIAIRLR